MSRTKRGFPRNGPGENGRAYVGKEWWGKRPLSDTTVEFCAGGMRVWKRLLHKIERRQGKEAANDYPQLSKKIGW